MNNGSGQSMLVVLRTFSDNVEAYIAKGVLESNGIVCILNDEIMSSVYPLTLTSIGGIKLLVRREDLDKAEENLSINTTD